MNKCSRTNSSRSRGSRSRATAERAAAKSNREADTVATQAAVEATAAEPRGSRNIGSSRTRSRGAGGRQSRESKQQQRQPKPSIKQDCIKLMLRRVPPDN